MFRKPVQLVAIAMCILLYAANAIASPNLKINAPYVHYPPYMFTSPEGKPDGILVDILSAAFETQNVDLEFTFYTYTKLSNLFFGKKIDFIPGSIWDFKHIRINQDLSYVNSMSCELALLSSSLTIKSFSDIEGKHIGILKGLIDDKHTASKYKANTIPLTTYNALTHNLNIGNIDAIILTNLSANHYIFNLKKSHSYQAFLLPEKCSVDIIFGESATDLKNKYKDGLNKIIQNGTYDRILKKHIKHTQVQSLYPKAVSD